jgi:hypothetical protein
VTLDEERRRPLRAESSPTLKDMRVRKSSHNVHLGRKWLAKALFRPHRREFAARPDCRFVVVTIGC